MKSLTKVLPLVILSFTIANVTLANPPGPQYITSPIKYFLYVFILAVIIEFFIFYFLVRKDNIKLIYLISGIIVAHLLSVSVMTAYTIIQDWFRIFGDIIPFLSIEIIIFIIESVFYILWFNFLFHKQKIAKKINTKKIIAVTLLANIISILIGFLIILYLNWIPYMDLV